jgi:von Willebrand factor type A domain
MRRFVCRMTFATRLLTILFLSIAAIAQSGKLDFADRIRLVSCDPSTTKPCFRLKFNVVDAAGTPLSLSLPANQDLRGQLKVTLDNKVMPPFFAIAQGSDSNTVRGRVALILVDISGSMNLRLASGKTRFQTAQEALQQFVEGLDESADRVAIVPFESHNVAEQIGGAIFATKRVGALTQIDSLPVPQPRNNTALYSAVVLGLQALAKQTAGSSAETMLIVMTDGKNEVFPGDDPGLLDGTPGLQAAASAAQSSGTQVICIGFGAPGSIDEHALRTISPKYFMAQDLDKLKETFTFARTLLTNRIVATVALPWADRSSLEGRAIPIDAELKLQDGRRFASDQQTWQSPQMGVPSFDGKCDAEELRAALQLVPGTATWMTTVRPVLVFFGLGTLLLVLWFWVPRLVWADQYIGTFATQGGGMRWASKSQVWLKSKIRPSRPAPPGFETRKGGAQPPRAPSDRTVVQPGFSRSRLQKRPPQS